MNHDLSERVRDAGYEALFLLGEFVALSIHPTMRNHERFLQLVDESESRRQQLQRLAKRGLIEANPGEGSQWVARLTDLGCAAFAGGRDPEAAWDREWDGKWRLLTFDLPRRENAVRMKLRRWLDANHFGRLQGSVWISPDPVPEVAEILGDNRIDAANVMVFEGAPAGAREPRETAETAWDFQAINSEYRSYSDFASRACKNLRGKTTTMAQMQKLLREDRRRWWNVVRRDPLLPKAVHPKGYEGMAAWKLRGKLLKQLGKTVGAAAGLT